MPAPDWDRLEAEGRIQPSPGREEAVQAAIEATRERKARKEKKPAR